MANRKEVKKTAKKTVAKKAVVKKVSRTTRSSSRSSQGFFEKHKHMKWLLPSLVLLLVTLFVVHHYMDETSVGEGAWKQDVRNAIHLDTDDTKHAVLTVTPSPTDNSTITPYVTVQPTQSY